MTLLPGEPVEIVIRAARTEDVQALARLAAQLGYPSSPEQMEIRLDEIRRDPRQRVRVAQTADGTVAGWIHVAITQALESDPEVEIRGLVVEESWRGRGIGGRLLEVAEAWAREQGVAAVRVRSNVMREEAHVFYQALGYKRLKTQHNFLKTL